ncbi:hypothetical protein C7B80_30970 [Cyanosarcina cf. burmensis CCALA 770]|nr:hypothetical protein C7B80_30970 [Cyanosarcina cf. burmensis CCALA 770]
MKVDFEKFKGSLPYASELYGVYQPLLGWKSRLITRRIEAGIESLNRRFVLELFPRFQPEFQIKNFSEKRAIYNYDLGLAQQSKALSPLLNDASSSFVVQRTIAKIEQAGIDNLDAWKQFTSSDELSKTLSEIQGDVNGEFKSALQTLDSTRQIDKSQVLSPILARESVTAGALSFLGQQSDLSQVMAMLMPTSSELRFQDRLKSWEHIVNQIDPRRLALDSAVISPIGIVHLFRQYFFEFDTFLGPSVEHIWLSPGGTVELIEVSTRRTLTERFIESVSEVTERSEKDISNQDELAGAVRQENMSNTKFGASVNTSSSGGFIVFSSQVNTGTSFEIDQNTKEAREETHKGLRQQTEKQSMELRRSFKSTFRTVTEITDTKSRRYVLSNTTDKLVNYELRRKMRQVGVQVQDYGTSLCWQTYVDKPGNQLGVAQLIHIAVPNDMQPKQDPDAPKDPQPYKGEPIRFSFTWPFTTRDAPNIDKRLIIRQITVLPQAGYKLDRFDYVCTPRTGNALFDFQREIASTPTMEVGDLGETTGTVIRIFSDPASMKNDPISGTGLIPEQKDRIRHPATDQKLEWDFEITPYFIPSNWLKKKITDEYKNKVKEATQERERQYKEKLFNSVKERVKLASNIMSRKYEDLREEERIIVYRNLIRQLMQDTGVEIAPAQVQHVFAELVNSMFDIEKMLYFVAPEWWLPRPLNQPRPSSQATFNPKVDPNEFKDDPEFKVDPNDFKAYNTVSWSGTENRPDNYYITEDSAPARLGSSLGWLIQLDGDNLRNAFLNAPWVKAVIPIREGKESEAVEWLSAPQLEDNRNLNADYQPGNPNELPKIRTELGLPANHEVTIKDAIQYLVKRIQAKQAKAKAYERDENNQELNYLPTDKVYERGFNPLGGFKAQSSEAFEIFDQWVEVVPTDQIVPVEVEYDPKTGLQRQKDVEVEYDPKTGLQM